MKAVVTVRIDFGKDAPLKRDIRASIKSVLDGACIYVPGTVTAKPLVERGRLPSDAVRHRIRLKHVTVRSVDID